MDSVYSLNVYDLCDNMRRDARELLIRYHRITRRFLRYIIQIIHKWNNETNQIRKELFWETKLYDVYDNLITFKRYILNHRGYPELKIQSFKQLKAFNEIH
jgi:hypothetical protein